MKIKAISVIAAAILLAGQFGTCFAMETVPLKTVSDAKNKNVFAYPRSDVKVRMDDKLYIFYDANGNRVYPLFYGGTAYLPIRGMASMLDKNIDWEQANRTIYIGRTLKNPDTEKKNEPAGATPYAVGVSALRNTQENSQMLQVGMQIRSDVRVLYNFEKADMLDSGEKQVYPAIVNNSAYLPIRAVSKLLNKKIEWDHVESTITISDNDKEDIPSGKPADVKEEQEKYDALFKKAAHAEIKSLDELNKQATANLIALRKEDNSEKKLMYAEAITQACKTVEEKKDSAFYKLDKLSEQQETVQSALNEYAQMLWHYTLIMENISYMAAANQDFSMLSETFVNFAVLTQQKQQIATNLLEELK